MREKLFSVTKDDLEIQFFTAGGKGGQNQNKVASACRVKHKASGAVGECREERHQHVNKERAFKRMTQTPEFQAWLKREIARVSGREAAIQDAVERSMKPSNLRIEVKDEKGRWVERSEDVLE